MTPANVVDFARELTLTAELFGVQLSPARIEAYHQALAHVEWARLHPAMIVARQTERFFPTPAVYLESLAGSPDAQATEALQDVWGVVDKTVSLANVDEDTREVVAAMGGWSTFQHARARDASILAAQFRKAYVASVKYRRTITLALRAEDALEGRAMPALPERS